MFSFKIISLVRMEDIYCVKITICVGCELFCEVYKQVMPNCKKIERPSKHRQKKNTNVNFNSILKENFRSVSILRS